MASLWKHPHSKYWVACFTDTNGRRLKRSTKTTNRKEAQKLAEAFEEAARKKRTATQMRRVIADLHQELTGEEVKNVLVRDYVEEWLTKKGPETAPSTLDFYRKSAGAFVQYLGDDDHGLDGVTPQTLTAYRNAEAKRVSSKTANHRLKVIRMVFRSARRDGLIADDPAEFVDSVRERSTGDSRRPFTLDELRAILRECDPEWRSLVLFGLYSGQRLGDLAKLTWANVDLIRGDLRLTTGKTNRRITLPLAEPLRRHLEALPSSDDPHGPLHPRAFAIMERTGLSGGLSNAFANVLAAAGLRERKPHRKAGEGRAVKRTPSTTSFHSLRHTATTLMHEAGIPASVTQQLIGHDSAAVHDGYVTVGRDSMLTAANSLPDVT